MKYLPGGVKSGFVHVDPDDEPKRLFQVKGKRNIKVKQVRSNSFFLFGLFWVDFIARLSIKDYYMFTTNRTSLHLLRCYCSVGRVSFEGPCLVQLY